MDNVGVELSLLARFVVACQSPRLADAARILGQTQSALSIALHGLEERLRLKLFVRRGGGLDLLPSAFWLFRAGARLLYLEQLCREARLPPQARRVRLSVELDLDFAIGRVTRALLRASQDLIATHPELLVEWRFASPARDLLDDPLPGPLPDETVSIFYGVEGGVGHARHLYDDPWIVVGSQGGGVPETFRIDELSILRMRPEIMASVTRFAAQLGFERQLRLREEEPSELAALLLDSPQLRLLMPSDLLPTRLGLARYEETPFEPRFVSSLFGRAQVSSAYGQAFLDAISRHLSQESGAVFTPRLTPRQIRYFNLTIHAGSISAAARVANTAQSSVSKQISQMEEELDRLLLNRTEEGATLTERGKALRDLTAGMEEGLDAIVRKSHDIAAHSEARVTIGTLPTSGHDSALTDKIAHVVTRIHARHPDWQLSVVEGSNTVLHERIRSGELNLAVVGIVNAQVARIPLGPSEPLSVIGNPAINFGGRKVLGIGEACALPLVLGLTHLSIHRSFAEAAQKRSLPLRPVIEVASPALAIAMVRQAPLCTILPASSVRQDIEAGNVVAIPIRQEELSGTLSLIFSAERALSDAERSIVQEFVRVFRPHQAPAAADHD